MKKFLIALFSLMFLGLNAQDTTYVRNVIRQLGSKSFAGRGYVSNGDRKAASFISSEFKTIGLKSFSRSYLQPFPISINTFPGKMKVKINGKELIPGVDFIVDPSACSLKFKGNVRFISNRELQSDSLYDASFYQLNEALIDTFNGKTSESAAISFRKFQSDRKKKLLMQLSSQKLTWSSHFRQSQQCLIILKSDLFDRSLSSASVEIDIEAKLINDYTTNNVIGYVPGKKYKDSFIVVTAHYDHLGKMGKNVWFPGANDNASGIAMLLSLARYYQNNPADHNIVFIAFSGEENGLLGSKYYVDHPLFSLAEIAFLINIDLMGNGAEGVMAVNGAVFKPQFELLKSLNEKGKYLPDVSKRGKAANSDHYWFSEYGVPCFFFYLKGTYPYYHDVFDKPEALPLTNFGNAFLLFRDFIDALQNLKH